MLLLLIFKKICAYCQEALESASIRTEGIKTWAILAEILDDEDLAPFLGQTFSVVLHYWSEFDIEAQSIAEKMILDMFKPKKRRAMLERCSAMIPSLENIPSLSTPTELMRLWRRGLTPEERLHQLVVRCSHENVIVVEYALMELRDCIKEYQDFIHHSAGNQKPDPVIAEIIRCLLDVIVTFKEPNLTARPRIERLCAECLGLIGAVNPNDVEAGRVKEDMLILHDFTIEGECAEFVLFFLEKLVVKQLLSATDTKSQGFLAWCAQKLLKYCVDTKQLIPSYRETQPPKLTGAQARWDALSSSVRGALTPLFDSRYSLTGEVSRKDFQYPLFSPDITCREWLNTILTELLCNPAGDGENVKPIFDACSRICKGQDISISMFLFPVAVLHTVISGTNTDRQNITKEFLAVLTHRGDSSYTPRMRNTLQQCVEV